MNQELNINNEANVESNVNIRGLLEYYFHFWPWFLLGLIISISIAFLNIRYSNFQYEATTSIMIKDNAKSGISKELEAFKDLGIIGANSSNNVINEIEIITSKTGMAQDPQSYIVGVEVRGLQEKWIYEENKGYQHVVSVSTRELLPQQLSA